MRNTYGIPNPGDSGALSNEVGEDAVSILDPEAFDVLAESERIDNETGYDWLYSMRLDTLVDWCLNDDDRKRPSLKQLVEETTSGLADYDAEYGGLSTKKREDVPEWFRVNWGDDEFKIGAVLGADKRKHRGGEHGGEADPYSSDEGDEFAHWAAGGLHGWENERPRKRRTLS
ncbi:hypothetical protein BU26DRAFT_50342 [Trematosphaeria pertusa]|uniref:Protein kinase domain-containing protein n=1 Tax=Trematosphaeria pertusa TaxID=390896 RepID=A0A6A6I7U1_9PLEO|nr:uncharacterized protein BU26DRAFT_50342 [Trematosphaeria pertusa]KAF2246624.1 hypothetical protein BU26DRAFT_50342 [Trematosphaeria pertusa]